jgi:hypothetical protein
MYYAFFTPTDWKGELELRGLKPGKHHVGNYPDGTDLGTVEASSDGIAKLPADFKEHLLLEVSSQP